MYIVILKAVSSYYFGPFATREEAVAYAKGMKNNAGARVAKVEPPRDGF